MSIVGLIERLRRLRPFLPEAGILLLGVIVRVTMISRYDAHFGYDAISHIKYIEWFTTHSSLPDIMYSRETHQAPLYYFVAAWILRLGFTWQGVAAFAALLGCLRLLIFAVGLILFVPGSRIARCVALGLAAILPASVHLDGMINCEAMLGFATALMILCAALMLTSDGRLRLCYGVALGLASAIALLSKISALAIIAALGTGVLIDVARADRQRVRRLAAPVLAAAILALSTGWYFAHNLRAYGKPIVSSYDGRDRDGMNPYRSIPLAKRRHLDFLFGWTDDIYREPRWPAGYQPRAHLLPVLIASTFADYYRYRFAPSVNDNQGRSEPDRIATQLSRISVLGGTILALIATAAWLWIFAIAWRKKQMASLAILLCPLFGLLGQIWYTWAYPVDWEGPIKGVLLQFAALPLCACVGLGISTMLAKRAWYSWIGGVLGLLALSAVAAYTIYCRFWSPVNPVHLIR